MTTSIVIPSYNGAGRIDSVLSSLVKQTHPPDEVIVVIDGSQDNTETVVSSFSGRLSGLRVIWQENAGRAGAKNRGAQEASGDLLLFLDDDMIADQSLIERHLLHHAQVPASILTGHCVLARSDSPGEFTKYRNWKNKSWTGHLQSPSATGEAVLLKEPFIMAANCSLPAGIYSCLAGFDVILRDAEDFDMAVRAHKMKIPLYFSASAVAVNNDKASDTCTGTIRRLREYTRAQIALREKKPELYKELSHYQVIVPKGLKGWIYKCFCRPFWIRSVDNNFWTWIPSRLRFKLYDIIITANGSYFPNRVSL